MPDATTLLKFRHLLEAQDIPKQIFEAINKGLEYSGCMMRGGSIVDATIIQAPSSTKKGDQYYFGLKVHVGVDAGSWYVHTVAVTGANVHDVTMGRVLLRHDNPTVYGDSGYFGLADREEIQEDKHLATIDYRINRRPPSVKKEGAFLYLEKDIEKRKSSIRCKVEHPFILVKRYFDYAKARYKWLHKNAQRLYTLFTSANIIMCLRAGLSF